MTCYFCGYNELFLSFFSEILSVKTGLYLMSTCMLREILPNECLYARGDISVFCIYEYSPGLSTQTVFEYYR